MRKGKLLTGLVFFSVLLFAGCSKSVETGPVPSITNRPSLPPTQKPTEAPSPTPVSGDSNTPAKKDYKAQYEESGKLQNLSEVYKDLFSIGIEVINEDIDVEKRQDLVLSQFSTLSCREDLNPDKILVYEKMTNQKELSSDFLDFSNAEKIIQFAKEHNMKFISSALITEEMPSWFFTPHLTKDEVEISTDESGNEVETVTFASAEVMEQRMEWYIREVISFVNGIYKEGVISFDVVENAIQKDDKLPKYFRKNNWYQTIGETYVSKAYAIARKVIEPGQKLLYSEDGLDDSMNRNATVELLKVLKEEKAVDGIAVIGNFTCQSPNVLILEEMFKKINETGLEITLKKFFINSRTNSDDDNTRTEEEVKARNAKRYKNIFAWFERAANKDICKISRITFEGLTDSTSPLNEPKEYVDKETGETVFGVQIPSYPYLFSDDLLPKDDYFAALQDESIKAY